jgi:hypothetical protein
MPRTARLQGVAMGLGVLAARATTGVAERLTRMFTPDDAPLFAQLVARAVLGGAGAALAAVPERHCQRLWVASLRSSGMLLRDGAAGGAVHDLGRFLQRRYPSQRGIRPTARAVGPSGRRGRCRAPRPARTESADAGPGRSAAPGRHGRQPAAANTGRASLIRRPLPGHHRSSRAYFDQCCSRSQSSASASTRSPCILSHSAGGTPIRKRR